MKVFIRFCIVASALAVVGLADDNPANWDMGPGYRYDKAEKVWYFDVQYETKDWDPADIESRRDKTPGHEPYAGCCGDRITSNFSTSPTIKCNHLSDDEAFVVALVMFAMLTH